MSGLLPRTIPDGGNGVFTKLDVNTLTVRTVAFINNLIVNAVTLSNLVVSTITGNPNVNIVATVASVNSDEILTLTNTKTITNKTIDVSDNSIIMDNISGNPNITSTINQQMRTTDNVNFGSVNTVGAVIAGSGCEGGFGLFDIINSLATDNTATINGVNPLTTDTNLTSHIAATTAHGTTSAIVGINDTQRLSAKNIAIPSCKFVDNSDSTKAITFNNLSATTGTTLTLTGACTVNRALGLPDADDQLVGRNTTDTLTNKTLTSCGGVSTILTGNPSYTFVGKGDLGYASNATAWFSGSAIGDICLRNTDTTKVMRIGVGGGTAQLIISNTLVSAIALSLTNGISKWGGRVLESSGKTTTTGGATTTLYTLFTSSNSVYMIELELWAYCTAGTDANTSSGGRATIKATNVGGTAASTIVSNTFSSAFSIGLASVNATNTVQIQVTGPAGDDIRWNYFVSTYVDNI